MKTADAVTRICLVGATGMVGEAVITAAVGREDLRVVAVARREMPLPAGARMEFVVAETARWGGAIARVKPDVLICALGTTIGKAGSQQAFRAIDHGLVIETAKAAREAGCEHFILVSAVGADALSRNFYLRTKGETEEALKKLRFRRFDVLRPSLLTGHRRESRAAERMASWFAPLMNLMLHGGARRFRAIRASKVAEAALALSQRRQSGRFVHDYDAMMRAIARRT